MNKIEGEKFNRVSYRRSPYAFSHGDVCDERDAYAYGEPIDACVCGVRGAYVFWIGACVFFLRVC